MLLKKISGNDDVKIVFKKEGSDGYGVLYYPSLTIYEGFFKNNTKIYF